MRSDFVISAYTLFPFLATRGRIVFYKEDITNVYFANYYQSKNHNSLFKNKETTGQSYRKISNKNTKKSLRISLDFLTLQERWEWIILAIWVISFLFCNENKNVGVYLFQLPFSLLKNYHVLIEAILDLPKASSDHKITIC